MLKNPIGKEAVVVVVVVEEDLIPSSALLTTNTALSLSMSSPSLSHTYVRTPVPTPIFHPEERKVYMFNAGPIEKKNFNFHPSLSFLASLFTMLSASIRLCACGFFFLDRVGIDRDGVGE